MLARWMLALALLSPLAASAEEAPTMQEATGVKPTAKVPKLTNPATQQQVTGVKPVVDPRATIAPKAAPGAALANPSVKPTIAPSVVPALPKPKPTAPPSVSITPAGTATPKSQAVVPVLEPKKETAPKPTLGN